MSNQDSEQAKPSAQVDEAIEIERQAPDTETPKDKKRTEPHVAAECIGDAEFLQTLCDRGRSATCTPQKTPTVTFQLTVTGPPDEQAGLRATMERGLRLLGDKYAAPEYAFDIDPAIWGQGIEDVSFIVQPWHHEDENGEHIFEPVPIHEVNGALIIEGKAEGKPPVAFIERASIKYPALSFDLTASTENRQFERWRAQAGTLVQLAATIKPLVCPDARPSKGPSSGGR
ncbi:MAG: hypothetical protein HQ567_33340 [Candidatus Nealsonbacteria bacterium]|nr:hypothetical protein [Candidatus Nealsonbacteria bacterium]